MTSLILKILNRNIFSLKMLHRYVLKIEKQLKHILVVAQMSIKNLKSLIKFIHMLLYLLNHCDTHCICKYLIVNIS